MGKAKIPGLAQAQAFGEQFLMWGILMQIAQTGLAPVWAALQQQAFKLDPDIPLSVADAIDAAVRSHLTTEEAAAEARLSGVNLERFKTLAANAGNPPGVAELLELWRRGIIEETGEGADSTSVEQGIREGRTQNKWIPALKTLRYQWPTPADALQALLEGQIDAATGQELYAKFGGDPAYFQMLFDTRGSAPTPLEAAQMARRGVIPWEGRGAGVVSFEQAFLEGPWRNKWLEPYREVSNYIPPPRTVVALLRAGTITDAVGLRYLEESGVKPDLAQAYVAEAHASKSQTTRELTAANVATLFAEKVIDEKDALAQLEKIGYTATDAALELSLATASVEQSQRTSALGRVRALYIGHHISEQQVIESLAGLQVETSEAAHLLATWKLERGLMVHTLTPAEIVAAVYYKNMAEEEAMTRLGQLGYGPRDAWIMIGNRLHGRPSTPEPASNIPPP